jgi:hypothetical protein
VIVDARNIDDVSERALRQSMATPHALNDAFEADVACLLEAHQA